jgi:pyruvate/2-oxoglutarate/acetoin dehydrogenase E1 component
LEITPGNEMPAMARTGGEEKKVIVIGQRGGAKGGVFSFLVTPQLVSKFRPRCKAVQTVWRIFCPKR